MPSGRGWRSGSSPAPRRSRRPATIAGARRDLPTRPASAVRALRKTRRSRPRNSATPRDCAPALRRSPRTAWPWRARRAHRGFRSDQWSRHTLPGSRRIARQARDRGRALPRHGAHRARTACRPHARAKAFLFHWALAPASFCSSPSWPASLYAGCLQQFGQFLARIKQPRLHCVFRYPDDLSDLFHGFLVVVDKIDDLPMIRRKRRQTLAQCLTGILLLRRHFRIVGRVLDRVGGLVVQFNVLPATQRRQGLEARNCQQPGGDGGSAFELASLAPHIEKDFADQVFRNLFVPHQPQAEAKHPDMMPSVQHLHGEAVALSDPSDQDVVRSRLCRTQWPSRKFGRIGSALGSMEKERFLKLSQYSAVTCD